MPLTTPDEIADLLRSARTIAMVGASDRPDRASFGVMAFLQSKGYRVIPVNPRITGLHVHGEYVWRDLSQIGEPIAALAQKFEWPPLIERELLPVQKQAAS